MNTNNWVLDLDMHVFTSGSKW